ncbi:MAG: hypothetical protein HOK21_07475 [Rhodospirillaceae bacterium]|jgi:hypothetical protein|nr:hypothetical protein [Rhodospirillaceae bacterium]MBT4043379.1 hypothetical protein [Rhodospirillaceae bacterium]MBT4690381.1 hypothetical protein [Rhodospirillaceae bacterium]MBT5083996.1 hypothetical protein [Rhodospirillaceae bacterium]MBT5523906.1 hypothetical protein [Rhodospirillaceae bacterium]
MAYLILKFQVALNSILQNTFYFIRAKNVVLMAVVVLSSPAWADRPTIGVLSSIDFQSQPSYAGQGHRLAIGQLITTGSSERAQLLFVDGSAIFMGPGSSLRLEEFSYEAASKSGELVVNVTSGTFRFIGGSISKKRPVLFKSQGAVVGIQGGVAALNFSPRSPTVGGQQPAKPRVTATMLYGDHLYIQAGSARQVVNRPGFKLSLSINGSISPPQIASQSDLAPIPLTSPGRQEQQLVDANLTPEQLGQIAPASGGALFASSNVARNQIARLAAVTLPRNDIQAGLPSSRLSRAPRLRAIQTASRQETVVQQAIAKKKTEKKSEEEEEKLEDDAGVVGGFILFDNASTSGPTRAIFLNNRFGFSPPRLNSFPNRPLVPIGGTVFGGRITETTSTRTTRTISGYSTGEFRSVQADGDPTAMTLFATADGRPSNIQISTSAETDRVYAEFTIAYPLAGISKELTLNFGDKDFSPLGNSLFLNDSLFGAINSTLEPSTGDTTQLALVADRQGTASTFSRIGITVCDCRYLLWGFWSGSIDHTNGSQDQLYLATWVAGDISKLSAIQGMTGTATYTGHVIGTVITDNNTHLATGDWRYAMNFDNPSASSGAVGNFDGGDYALSGVALAAAGAGHKFSGTVTGDSSATVGRNGTFTGSFMSGGGDDAAEMGGQILISGPNYQSAAIFAARKSPEP